jgi:hypothetical protein
VQIDGVTYIEQNKKKDTIYAQMANQVCTSFQFSFLFFSFLFLPFVYMSAHVLDRATR